MSKTLPELEEMISTAKEIKNDIKTYKSRISRSDCDKFGMGFNKDHRFSTVQIQLHIDSWTGYYGDSGCSSVINIIDKESFKEHLIKILNKRFEEIMFEVSDSMLEEAKKYKAEAKKELNERLKKIEQL